MSSEWNRSDSNGGGGGGVVSASLRVCSALALPEGASSAPVARSTLWSEASVEDAALLLPSRAWIDGVDCFPQLWLAPCCVAPSAAAVRNAGGLSVRIRWSSPPTLQSSPFRNSACGTWKETRWDNARTKGGGRRRAVGARGEDGGDKGGGGGAGGDSGEDSGEGRGRGGCSPTDRATIGRFARSARTRHPTPRRRRRPRRASSA